MKILLATSEAVPFAKTGGLADVCGALPLELARLGHEPTLIMPAYRQVFQAGLADRADRASARSSGRAENGQPAGCCEAFARRASPAECRQTVPVYFVEQSQYFDRDHLYGSGSQDYRDNCERFVFFSRAVLESIRAAGAWRSMCCTFTTGKRA